MLVILITQAHFKSLIKKSNKRNVVIERADPGHVALDIKFVCIEVQCNSQRFFSHNAFGVLNSALRELMCDVP